jgi:hypothetical protein
VTDKETANTGGYGAQVHGSRKGLGGDPPNGPVKGTNTWPRGIDPHTPDAMAGAEPGATIDRCDSPHTRPSS